jgi:hypothetical protein
LSGRPATVLALGILAAALVSSCTHGTQEHLATSLPSGTSVLASGNGVSSGTPECPPSPLAPGFYRKTIRPADVASVHDPILAKFVQGVWTMGVGVASPSCYYTLWFVQRVKGAVTFVDAHPFTVPASNEITKHGAQESAGTYRIVHQGGLVQFRLVSDSSFGRPLVVEIVPWRFESAP